MKRIFIVVFYTILLSYTASAQNFVWARQLGDNGTAICTDASGNVIIAGTFSGTKTFGAQTYTALGASDIFITKLNPAGTFLWSVKIGNATTSSSNDEKINGITCDASGNIYAVGSFSGTVDFNPGTLTNNLTSAGNTDAFILKLNSSGTYIWAKNIGGGSSERGNGIALDNSNNVYTTGVFQSGTDFNPDASATFTLTAPNVSEPFVSKLDENGTFVWAKSFQNSQFDLISEGVAVAVNSTNGYVYVAGRCRGVIDFNPGAAVVSYTNTGYVDPFVVRLTTAGVYSSHSVFQGYNTNVTNGDAGKITALSLDASGNVHLTGIYKGTFNFNPNSAPTAITSAGGGTITSIFVCKMPQNPANAITWAKAFQSGSAATDKSSIGLDYLNNVYVSGYFTNSPDFDPGTGTYNITSNGSNDAFVNKLDANGNFVWAKAWGSTGDDKVLDLALDASGNVYTTGAFSGTVDFDPNSGTSNISGGGGFGHKLSCTLPSTVSVSLNSYSLCVGTSTTIPLSISNPESNITYSWSVVGATGVNLSTTTGTTTTISFTATTSYSIVVTGTNVCGATTSTVSSITVNALPNVTAQASPTAVCTGSTLTLNGNGALTYTWSNGVSNNVGFVPSASATYTVTGTDNKGCKKTATVNVAIINNPTVNVAGKNSVCLNKVNILTGSGASTYTWQPGSISGSTINASPSTNTTYTVTGTASNGCRNAKTFSVNVVTPQTPDICMVTVDSLGLNNEIYWEKTLYNNADSFIVYREVSTGIFKRIGASSKNAYSMYLDTNRSIGPNNGDPTLTFYKYKLQIRDTCGNYGALSLWHETMFFQDQQNGNFNWTSYAIESTPSPVSNYNLIRRDVVTGAETTVGSTSGGLFTDPQYNSFWPLNYTWFADAIGFNCNPTQKVAAQKVKTKSNHANDKLTTGIKNSYLENMINVYPNPATNKVTVLLSSLNSGKILLYNVFGQLVFNEEMKTSSITFNTEGYSRGVYFLHVTSQNNTIVIKKIILE